MKIDWSTFARTLPWYPPAPPGAYWLDPPPFSESMLLLLKEQALGAGLVPLRYDYGHIKIRFPSATPRPERHDRLEK